MFTEAFSILFVADGRSFVELQGKGVARERKSCRVFHTRIKC